MIILLDRTFKWSSQFLFSGLLSSPWRCRQQDSPKRWHPTATHTAPQLV